MFASAPCCITTGSSTAAGCLASEACLLRGCLCLRPGARICFFGSSLLACTLVRNLCFLLPVDKR